MSRNCIEVNVLAAMATVDAVLPAMRARGQGQIALISSLAAYYGLPVTPSYCASKAAIKTYGEAIRGWLAAKGCGQRGHAGLCRIADVPRDARAEALPVVARASGALPSGAVWRATRRASAFRFPSTSGPGGCRSCRRRSRERILRLLDYGG
jgi:NAD(P)-dependent dehydrogenase (short-subunit alcohol dehydrogenase family)